MSTSNDSNDRNDRNDWTLHPPSLWPDEVLDPLRTELQETGRVRTLGQLLPLTLAYKLCDDLGIDRSRATFEAGYLILKPEEEPPT